MVTKDQKISLIALRIANEIPGYWSIFFARPANFEFASGDWMDIAVAGRSLKGGITYSLSSSPTEAELRITFREGISEFKRALLTVQPGDEFFISQYGNDYDFRLKNGQSSTLIAGGVGIAPFRGMIKEIYDTNTKADITLIYLNQTETFLFRKELEEWAKALSGVSIVFIVTKELTRKKRENIILSHIKSPHQNYYVSGPPAMVESTEHLLINSGVHVRDIRIDSFGGY